MDSGVEPYSTSVFRSRRAGRDDLPPLPLRPLIAEYTATFWSTWRPVTRRKHADDFARLVARLTANGLPITTASLDFPTLVDYVGYLRVRPKVSGVWRGAPDALGRSLRHASVQTLSLNSINAYLRPLRSLVIWLVDEGLLSCDPFRRSRRSSGRSPAQPASRARMSSSVALFVGVSSEGRRGLRAARRRERRNGSQARRPSSTSQITRERKGRT